MLKNVLDPLPPIAGLTHRVHKELEKLIVLRTLPLGTRLVEGELAQTLGVSRGPIRAALQQLAQDGFVDLRPRQGAFVRTPTPKEIDDFYAIRRLLEGESARLATRRITPAGEKRLRERLEFERMTLANNEDPAASGPNFHTLVSDIADNHLLVKSLDLHRRRSFWYKAPFEPIRRKKSWEEHAVILSAIVSGDADRAAAMMHAHIDAARVRFEDVSSAARTP